MIVFSNASVAGLPVSTKEINTLMLKKLKSLGVLAKLNTDSNIVPITARRLFNSVVTNTIPLEDTDPRVAKLARNYLETERLTKEQWDVTTNTLVSYYASLGIDVLIEFQEFADDPASKQVLVKGKVVLGTLPAPSSFATKIGA